MGLLKRQLPGSTIIEAIVASLIFMMVFAISLSTVTGFTLREHEGYALLEAERQLTACIDRYCGGIWPERTYGEEYEWGKITIKITPYESFENMQAVTLTAWLAGSRKTIEYRQLTVKRND